MKQIISLSSSKLCSFINTGHFSSRLCALAEASAHNLEEK